MGLLCLKFERTLILGNFNTHKDIKDSTTTKEFLSLLECFDLNQLVDCPIPKKRPYSRSIEPSDFSYFIGSSLSVFSPSHALEDQVLMLNSVLSSGLDLFAPLKSDWFPSVVLLPGIMRICVL